MSEKTRKCQDVEGFQDEKTAQRIKKRLNLLLEDDRDTH